MRLLHLSVFVALASICNPVAGNAQIYRTDGQYVQSIKVTVGSNQLTSPWAGGMNNPQFSMADMDHDGKEDLVVYESGKGVKTFMNTGTATNPVYVYNPEYEYLFPFVNQYFKMIDYNNDGAPDLFHFGWSGLGICDGYYNSQNRLAFKNCRDIRYILYPQSGTVNIGVNPGDIPAIVDIDHDGDLDVLAFNQNDDDLIWYYKNMCKEEGLPPETFKLKLKSACWGKMQPVYYLNRSHKLALNCSESWIPAMPPPGGGGNPAAKTTGSGSHCITLLNYDGDGDYDMFDAYQGYPELQLLKNGKADYANTVDTMIAQDTMWQTGGVKVDMPNFPVAYWLDIDHDGDSDLMIAPHIYNSEDVKCVAYYKNTGTVSAPVYTYQTDNFIVGDMTDVGSYSRPVFYDYDKDGKKDLIVGSTRYDRATQGLIPQLSLFKNTSTGSNVSFELVTNNLANVAGTPFGSIAPAIGDVDNDGMDDLILGKKDGTLAFYSNHASSNNLQPIWLLSKDNITKVSGGNIDVTDYATPCLYDMDKDGKLDIVVGNATGYLTYLHNEGTAPQDLKLDQVTDKLGNVFVGDEQSGFQYPGYSAPFIGHIDNTNKDYLLVGNSKGVVTKFDGIANGYNNNAAYTKPDSIYSGIAIKGGYASPVVTDLDGDTTFYDMFVGNDLGGMFIYRQIFKESVDETTRPAADKHTLNMYPNPAESRLTIDAGSTNMPADAELKIYNATGQRVMPVELHRDRRVIDINVEPLPQGLYLCTVMIQGVNYSSVFIKK